MDVKIRKIAAEHKHLQQQQQQQKLYKKKEEYSPVLRIGFELLQTGDSCSLVGKAVGLINQACPLVCFVERFLWSND